MKLPKVTKALGFAALAGVATSVSAANLTLAVGQGPSAMPSDESGGPAAGTELAGMNWVANQGGGGGSSGDWKARLESKISDWGGGKLAFWYKVVSLDHDRQNVSVPIDFMGVFLNGVLPSVDLNQEIDALPSTMAAGNASYGGNSVAFSYSSDPITENSQSTWLVIYTGLVDDTSVPGWESKYIGKVQLTGGGSQNMFGLVPVPEPATYAGLFGLGLAGFAAYRRFRS